jgi:hypothetical protein
MLLFLQMLAMAVAVVPVAVHGTWFGGESSNPCVSGGEQCCAGLCSGPCSGCKTCHLPCTHCKTCCTLACTAIPAPFNQSVPNVLLVGDSISGVGTGYLTNVQEMLGPSASTSRGGGPFGNAFVQSGPSYGKNYCGTSYGVVDCAKIWADHPYQGWDVIHFNWGLHDICPKMYVPIAAEQYEENMEALYLQLKRMLKTNGTLIWTTTTPVPPSYKNRNNSDVIRINNQMRTLFGPGSRHPKVVVHDLYGEVVQRCHRDPAARGYPETSDCVLLQDNGVHFSTIGRQYTGIMVSAAIAPYL